MSEAAHKPKRQRSPSYPAIDLEAALERARVLYDHEGRNVAPNDAILEHWGYASRSGLGFGTLGALKRFGLLWPEGPGKSKLSDLALSILLDERDDTSQRSQAIQQAALSPTIHREIWETYPGGLPSDGTLRHFLRLDKGFTDSAANELIQQFRKTLAFAQLTPGDMVSGDEEDSDDGGPPLVTTLLASQRSGLGKAAPQVHAGSGVVSVPLPLSANEWVTLQGPFPLTEDAWDQLMRVLAVMKPGLVAPTPDESKDS